MYIEQKGDSLGDAARIGWMTLSKSKRSYFYNGKTLMKVSDGHKYNCVDEDSGEKYWVSAPKIRGGDTKYGGVVEIDEDARVEYWLNIRNQPEKVNQRTFKG